MYGVRNANESSVITSVIVNENQTWYLRLYIVVDCKHPTFVKNKIKTMRAYERTTHK